MTIYTTTAVKNSKKCACNNNVCVTHTDTTATHEFLIEGFSVELADEVDCLENYFNNAKLVRSRIYLDSDFYGKCRVTYEGDAMCGECSEEFAMELADKLSEMLTQYKNTHAR